MVGHCQGALPSSIRTIRCAPARRALSPGATLRVGVSMCSKQRRVKGCVLPTPGTQEPATPRLQAPRPLEPGHLDGTTQTAGPCLHSWFQNAAKERPPILEQPFSPAWSLIPSREIQPEVQARHQRELEASKPVEAVLLINHRIAHVCPILPQKEVTHPPEDPKPSGVTSQPLAPLVPPLPPAMFSASQEPAASVPKCLSNNPASCDFSNPSYSEKALALQLKKEEMYIYILKYNKIFIECISMYFFRIPQFIQVFLVSITLEKHFYLQPFL